MDTSKLAVLEKMLSTANVGVWEYDIAAKTLEADDTLIRLLGLAKEDALQQSKLYNSFIHQEDYDRVMKKRMACIEGKCASYKDVFKMRCANGNAVWVMENVAVTAHSEGGKPLKLAGLVHECNHVKRGQEAERAENQYREYVARMAGLGSWTWNVQTGKVLLSEDMCALLGYERMPRMTTPDEMLNSFFPPETMQSLRKRIEHFMLSPGSTPVAEELAVRHSDGRDIWILNIWNVARTDSSGMPEIIHGTVMDIDSRVTAEQKLRESLKDFELHNEQLRREVSKTEVDLLRNQRLLEAINSVATSLLQSDTLDFDSVMWNALKTVGEAAGVQRAYVWENFERDGRALFRQIYEWSGGAEPQQGKDFAIETDYEGIDYWREHVYGGRTINALVKNLPGPEREVLAAQDIVSILVLPIHQGGEIWGFIGFDDCVDERLFDADSERMLNSAGMLMVSAIVRNKATLSQEEIQKELIYQEHMLQATNDAASALLSARDNSFHSAISATLKILGHSVNSDRAYLWHYYEDEGRHYADLFDEWTRDGCTVQQNYPRLCVPVANAVPGWQNSLAKRETLNGLVQNSTVVNPAHPFFAGVSSLIIIPLLMDDTCWGVLGLDSYTRKRPFTNAEQDILSSAGMMIENAIHRNMVNKNLVEAREQALLSMNAKTEFLSRMSHEIRTPMNAIIGMTTIAKKTTDADRLINCLEKIDTSSRQLLGLINDILDMSKIEANKLEIVNSEFNFEEMMQNVCSVIQVRMEEKRQDFSFDFDQPFHRSMIGDELRITQVLTNLLTNAVKFTPEGGRVNLKVRSTNAGENRSLLRVEVQDSGIGISAERQAKLFRMFEQADGSITRQYGGTGLGLAICKSIVHLMDGEIWVESQEGKGSNFIFEIPVQWGGPLEELKFSDELFSRLRVLVVDDAPDVLEYFTNILQSFNIECDTCGDSRRALGKVQQALDAGKPYDVVFIDWNMPHINGGALAQKITSAMDNHIIMIMISVSEWADIEPQAKEYGLQNFLPKPVLPSAIYNTLLKLTSRYKKAESTCVAQETRDWGGKTILLVEDIEINREIVISILEETGAEIDIAVNGEQAVAMFAKNPGRYNLILMDVQMPVMDGLTATRRIRGMNTKESAEIPIVAMTANAFKEDENDCLAAGMSAHLTKPLELDKLFDTLACYFCAGQSPDTP